MKVIAGRLKGRTILTPSGRGTRPTQGHVRQVLFDVLGGSIEDCRVLDLFAGSGAIGIEALSRGASEVCFVERSRSALRCLRENVKSLELEDRSRIVAAPVAVGLRILEELDGSFGWIFADPPYDSKPDEWIRRAARDGSDGLLSEDGTLVLESSCRKTVAEEIGSLRRYRVHRVGETCLGFYMWDGRSDEAQGDIPGDL